VADDILSLKGSTFAVNRDFHGDSEQERSRTTANKRLPLFQEQAYAWFIRELGFEISCSMIRHVAWF
jgi:hypothetical protein